MFNNFGINITNIFKLAEKERSELKHPYVGTEHLLLAILKSDQEMANYLKKYNLSYENFKKELVLIVGNASKSSNYILYTPLLKRVINNAIDMAKENNNGNVTTKHLIISLLEEGEGIAIRILVSSNIDIDGIYDDLCKSNKSSNNKLELLNTGILLNEFVSLDEVVVGRDKEIDLIIETLLRKKKNNPILIGDAGVGKTAIIEELTRRIMKKEVPECLFDTKIVSLEMGALVSGTKYRGEFEEKLTKIISELESNPNIILFIDEIHSMVNAGGAEGAITAGDIFKPALARGNVKCIGATTKDEYLKYFSSDKALMRRFEVVNIDEPNNLETKEILLKVKKEYEKHHNIIIPNEIIDKVIMYTNMFITNKKNPDKSLDFLDSICSKIKNKYNYNCNRKELYQKLEELKKEKENSLRLKDYEKALNIYNDEIKIKKEINNKDNKEKLIVHENDILDVLGNKTNMIFNIKTLDFLNDIKIIINKKLYGVGKYIDEVINCIRDNVNKKSGFLKICLEGESYLGKSTLIKELANNYPKCDFIKIDLNEYKTPIDINKLIGTPQGYVGYNDSYVFNKLKNNHFNIILFDHYNLAHDNIKNLIKEILKEGVINDNKGEIINFNNSYIFITNDVTRENKVGFDNNSGNNNENELYDLVDKTIYFNKLTKRVLNKYLDNCNIINKEYVINNSKYEKYNYKNVGKLINECLNIKN